MFVKWPYNRLRCRSLDIPPITVMPLRATGRLVVWRMAEIRTSDHVMGINLKLPD